MTSGNKHAGKYFLLRLKSLPSLVLEVKNGSKAANTEVVVSEFQMQAGDASDYQLWFMNQFSKTLCNKLTGFCIHSNDDKTIVVRPYSQSADQQKWQVDNDLIKLQSQPNVTLGVAGSSTVSNGALCHASTDSENGHWILDRLPSVYMYINSKSNSELVLDVRKADRKPGAKVIVYANKGDLADNQLWYENENGVLLSKLNGYALDASGKEVVLSPYDPRNVNQQWVIDGNLIRNSVKPNLSLSFKSGSLLSSPSLFADDSLMSQTDSAHRQWNFVYLHQQLASLSHSGYGKFFTLRCLVGGLVLQVEGKLIEPGSQILTAEREGNCLRQQFYVDEVTGTLRSALRNYCVDIDNNGFLVINPYDPYKKTQQWAIVGKKIQNRHSTDEVLQLCGTSTSTGSRVTSAKYNGSENQHWETSHVPARCFFIVSQMNGKVLDVKGDEASAGAAVIIFERKSPPCLNQLWYEDENGLIRSKLNGYVIDTRNGEATVRPFDSSIKQQHWMIVGDRVQNKFDQSQVLDIYGNSSFSTKVGSYTFRGSDNQRWKFETV